MGLVSGQLPALADLVDPAAENAVERVFDVDELDAHANARLMDAHSGGLGRQFLMTGLWSYGRP